MEAKTHECTRFGLSGASVASPAAAGSSSPLSRSQQLFMRLAALLGATGPFQDCHADFRCAGWFLESQHMAIHVMEHEPETHQVERLVRSGQNLCCRLKQSTARYILLGCRQP